MLPLPDTTVATRKRIARKYKLAQLPDPRPFLHIRCGEDILEKLDQAGMPGDKIRWTDVLSEGPLHHHATHGRALDQRGDVRRHPHGDARDDAVAARVEHQHGVFTGRRDVDGAAVMAGLDVARRLVHGHLAHHRSQRHIDHCQTDLAWLM